MPEIRHYMSANLVRHPSPLTQAELNERHGLGSSIRMGTDAMVVLSLGFADDALATCDVLTADGRTAGSAAYSPGKLSPLHTFEAWVMFTKTLAHAVGLSPERRGLLEAVINTYEEIAKRTNEQIRMQGKNLQRIEGCPDWIGIVDDALGIEVNKAWGELLERDVDELLQALPIGLSLEWKAYLAGFSAEVGRAIAKATGGKRLTAVDAAPRVVSIIRGEIRKAIGLRKHPALEQGVPNADP